MFHTLPELPALSLAVTTASQWESWVLCMGASRRAAPQAAPCPGPSLSASFPNFLQPVSLGNQTESRREEDGRRAGLASQLHFTWRIPGCPCCKDAAGMLNLPQKQGLRSGHTNGRTPAKPQRSHVFCPHLWRLLAMAQVHSGHRCGGKPWGRATAGMRCRRHPRTHHPDLPQKGLEPGCSSSFPAAPRLGLELRLRMCLFKQY